MSIVRNVQDVRQQVDEIRVNRRDDEKAHSMEDRLHADVLRAVVRGEPEAKEMARVALTTNRINFGRWCG